MLNPFELTKREGTAGVNGFSTKGMFHTPSVWAGGIMNEKATAPAFGRAEKVGDGARLNEVTSTSNVKDFAVAVAAGAALLWGSLANFITHNDYPIMRPEVGLVALLCLVFCVLFTPVYLGQRRWGRSFLEGLLAALFVDLNSSSGLLVLAVGCAVAAVTYWRRMSLLGPMAIFGVVIVATTLVGGQNRDSWMQKEEGPTGTTGSPDNGKPAILHLILDEHIGIEGFPPGAESQQLKDEVSSFYRQAGFVVYGRAYSQHMHTVNALPAVLNYGEDHAGQVNAKKGVVVGQTRHLNNLVDAGYRLTIYQSDFADFCTGARFAECVTYDSSSLRPTLQMNLSTMELTRLIGLKFISLSEVVEAAVNPWNVVALLLRRNDVPAPLLIPVEDSRTSTVGTLGALDELSTRLRRAEPGEAIFAHLLMPHYPYVVDRDCKGLRFADWKRRLGPYSVKVKQAAYLGQLRCTTAKVGQLLEALERSPAGTNAVVIIHGDHGSRITRVDPNEPNVGKFSDSDMIAAFSTIFAVRAPGVTPAYSSIPQSIPLLLRDFATAGFQRAPNPVPSKAHFVTLDDDEWVPTRKAELPAAWLN